MADPYARERAPDPGRPLGWLGQKSAIAGGLLFEDAPTRTDVGSSANAPNLTANDARVQRVRKVMNDIALNAGLEANVWKIAITDAEDIVDAEITSVRQVVVTTDLLDATKSDGPLAFVLGHALGHQLMDHDRRAVSWLIMQNATSRIGKVLFLSHLVANVFGYYKRGWLPLMMLTSSNQWYFVPCICLEVSNTPHKQTEADKIGLMLMTLAGYNPTDAARMVPLLSEAERHIQPQGDWGIIRTWWYGRNPSGHGRLSYNTSCRMKLVDKYARDVRSHVDSHEKTDLHVGRFIRDEAARKRSEYTGPLSLLNGVSKVISEEEAAVSEVERSKVVYVARLLRVLNKDYLNLRSIESPWHLC